MHQKGTKMIKNKLMVILAENEMNIKELASKLEMNYSTLWNFAKNKTQAADYKLLNKICKTLKVTPGDILKYIPDEE